MSADDEWELSPQNSHPRAARLLADQFYWDPADDNSPFGNDTGADTLALFREWRKRNARSAPLDFLNELLGGWGVADGGWDAVGPARVRRLLEEDEYSLIVRDDAVIALAFGQLLLEGVIDGETRRRALSALRRQAQPAVVEHRGWDDPEGRTGRLAKMAGVLEGV